MLDKGLVAKDTLDDFTEGALNPCTVDGKVYCLRNDLAQDGALVQQDADGPVRLHRARPPGRSTRRSARRSPTSTPATSSAPSVTRGLPRSTCGPASARPTRSPAPSAITVNTTRREVQAGRAAARRRRREQDHVHPERLRPRVRARTSTGKVLMMPGPAWYGGAIFNNPAVAQRRPRARSASPRRCPGRTRTRRRPATSAAAPGSISSHSQEPQGRREVRQFVTTDDDYQVDLAPGLPGVRRRPPTKWIAKQQDERLLRQRHLPRRSSTAAGQVWAGWGSAAFSQEAIWAKTITPVMAAGKTVASTCCPTWQTAIENQARSTGTRSASDHRRRRERRRLPSEARAGRARRPAGAAAPSATSSSRPTSRCSSLFGVVPGALRGAPARSPTATAASPGIANFTKVDRTTSGSCPRSTHVGDLPRSSGWSRCSCSSCCWRSSCTRSRVALAEHGRCGSSTTCPGALAGASQRAALAVRARSVRESGRLAARSCSASTASPTSSRRATCRSIFAIIAFWTGAGGWIVVMYGALEQHPVRGDRGRADRRRRPGADRRCGSSCRCCASGSPTWRILSLAAGTQLFVEPQLLSQASNGDRAATTTRSTSSRTSTPSTRTTSTARPRSPSLLLVVALVLSRGVRRARRPVRDGVSVP